MKLKDKQTYMAMGKSELQKKLDDIKNQIFEIKSETAIKAQKNLRAIKNLRRDLAVIMTYISQKELKK